MVDRDQAPMPPEGQETPGKNLVEKVTVSVAASLEATGLPVESLARVQCATVFWPETNIWLRASFGVGAVHFAYQPAEENRPVKVYAEFDAITGESNFALNDEDEAQQQQLAREISGKLDEPNGRYTVEMRLWNLS